MTVRASKALRNHMLGIGNLAEIFKQGKLVIYSGAAPTNAEDAATGTALVTVSDASGALTSEVLATGTVSITGTAGTMTSLTVNSVNVLDGATVPFNGSASQTASDLADAINRGQSFPKYTAAAVGIVVTISAPRGTGTAPNTFVVAATGITATTANMAGGVAGVNGLKFSTPAAGVVAKLTSQTWSGVIGTGGTAGYWRLYASVSDTGVLDASETFPRLQGSVATSGGDINLTSTTLALGATQTINTFAITMPA